MKIIDRLVKWYGKRMVYGVGALILLLIILGVGFSLFNGGEAPEENVAARKSVEVREAGMLESENAGIRTVGTVRSVSEARLETESGGRVTAVNVSLGDYVGAGAVIASLENSRERAALIQAEGAYEATQVANNQATIGLAQAETNARNTYRSAFTTADDAVRTLIDNFFYNPDSANPGFRIIGFGATFEVSPERVAIGEELKMWNDTIRDGTDDEDAIALLNSAEARLTRISDLLARISTLLARSEQFNLYTDEEIAAYQARFLATRSRVDGEIQAITSTRTSLQSAQQSASSDRPVTESDARLKQALGTLRAAQANYEKTLVRSPIAGTVNALYLRANEYVSPGMPAAVVANNGALEITTSISEEERGSVNEGDAVTINDSWTGIITHIAPAVDPLSGKIEVRLGVDEKTETGAALENGTTVSLTLASSKATTTNTGPLRIPLRSIKMTAAGPIVFSVNSEGALAAHAVELGPIVGDVVTITSGIDATSKIVADARGLKEGERVDVK